MIELFKPLFILIGVWVVVFLLYTLRLSELIIYPISLGIPFLIIAFSAFIIGYLFVFVLHKKIFLKAPSFDDNDFETLERRVNKFFLFWLFLTIIEVFFSGGVPLLWIIQGSSKTYFDFGLPSLHGFLNALQVTLGILSFYLYLKVKHKKMLYIALFLFVWQIIVISRQILVVQLIEIFYIYYITSKSPVKVLKNAFLYGFIFIIVFGVVGDIRTGKEHFYELALPSKNWIDWLPSGFLWVYIYLVTPLNNLIYNFTIPISPNNYDFGFANTTILLFPSILRKFIYGDSSIESTSGNLISEAFNVSSAFTSPYLDAGYVGIFIFCVFVGAFSFFFWWKNNKSRLFYRAIIAQCLLLTIFYNHFFYLPIIFQLFWVSVIVRSKNATV